MKELGDDDSLFVRHIHAWVGDAFEKGVTGSDLIIQDSVIADDLGIDVGEQSVGNVLLLAELREDVLIII
jgi:hypothetical protein